MKKFSLLIASFILFNLYMVPFSCASFSDEFFASYSSTNSNYEDNTLLTENTKAETLIKIIFSILITATIYMIVPLTLAFSGSIHKKNVLAIVFINAIIAYIFFNLLYYVLNISTIASPKTACFYGIINYIILNKSAKDTKNQEKKNES